MERLSDLLSNFNSLDKLKRLFWEELNYDRVNEPVPVTDWNYKDADAPIIFAEGGSQEVGGFKVLYTKLKSKDLRLMHERTIITQLLRDYPYALFVFSNENEDTWHFVNVKIAVTRDSDDNRKPQKRRLFRRLTIAPPYNHLHTAIDRITMLDLERVSGRDLFGLSPLAIQQQHDTAFDVEAVTKEFFREYRRVFENAERSITGIEDEEAKRLFTQKLFNRLMFIIFLEKKGWLTFNGSKDYVLALWKDYQSNQGQLGDHNFYNDRLKSLWFVGLNNPDDRPKELVHRIGDIPYLNGGLFERSEYDEEDSTVVVPDDALRVAINDIFYRFNFTVVESTPLDVEVAVDPEMLGKIFEELVTGRHESGSYYTPKPVVSFMGREALKGYLQTACPDETPEAIAKFVDDQQPDDLRDPEKVLEALKTVTICDPACGSGAYLVGMLHELVDLRLALFHRKEIDAITGYERKLEIIQNNIYGVDIDPFAVNIARLRLWLSLIVEFEGDKPLPLPNLDFKIEIGNSLTAPDPSGGSQPDLFRAQTIRRFNNLKNEYLVTHDRSKKLQIRDDIAKVRNEIERLARLNKGYIDGFDWAIEFAEIFLNGGFNILVANPPYVRIQSLSEDEVETLSAMYKSATANYDLYITFVERGLQLLAPHGIQSYILPHKFFNAKYGANLRKLISQGHHLRNIIHFGDRQVFDGATTYTCILILGKASYERFSFSQVTNIDAWINDKEANTIELPSFEVTSDEWVFNAGQVYKKLTQIETRLSDIAEKIFVGLQTSADSVYILRAREAKEDSYIVQSKALKRSYEIERGILRPLLKGSEIRRYTVDPSENLILFPYKLENNNVALMSQSEIQQQYPLAWDYLSDARNILESRENGRWRVDEWWQYGRNQNISEMPYPKILNQVLANQSSFTLDSEGAYCFVGGGNAGGYGLRLKPDCDYSELFILGILNSNVADYYIKQISTTFRGGYYSYAKRYTEKLPIPDVSLATGH